MKKKKVSPSKSPGNLFFSKFILKATALVIVTSTTASITKHLCMPHLG